MFDLLKMLRKETISDDSLMPYPNMDVYLTSPQSNLNVIAQQKSMNQIANVVPPSYNVYINNKQMENMRGKQCSMRQIIPNHNNNGVLCNRTVFNSNSALISNNEGIISMGDLYMIAENYNPIEKLTLPVNNGMLCNPFTLPNNQITTEIEFNLTEESLKEIVHREDLDIVLLSRLTKETSFNLIIWPLSISISINDTPLVLDTKMCNKIPVHLPQYIKTACVVGRNVVKFDILDISKFNAAMFQFQIYMVHRPTIEHAKKLAISHAFDSDELTLKLLHDICMTLGRDFVNVSTICPITNKRIEIAARLKCCTHLQPFDLIAFLKIQARWMLTSCPLCYCTMPFNFNGFQQNIVIDKILQQIFDRTPNPCLVVQVHVNGQFTPLNPIHSGIEFSQEIPSSNNGIMQNRHNPKHFAELNGNTIMHASQPMPPVYRPPDQSLNFQMVNGNPHRMINTPFNNMSIDSRSMLDLHPSDEQTIIMSMQPNMKYPHQALPCTADKPLVKKPVKRKLPRKSTPKSKIDVNPNIANNANNMSNGAITPPSTRTSSVASTSSPDSLNVPHLNHKRPPSIDLLPSTVLSDCHLSIGDDPALFSATSISQMNNPSFSHPTQAQQQHFQQQQHVQQFQQHQQQHQQQQHQQQQQQQQQQQLQQHYHHLYQLPQEQKSFPSWPIPEQIAMQQQQRNLQQHQSQQPQQQPQHHQQIHQQIQHQQIQHQQIQHQQIQHQQIQHQLQQQHIQQQHIQQHTQQHTQQQKIQQSKIQEFHQQQILSQQQPQQQQQLHQHLQQQQIQHKSQQPPQQQDQQFNGNLSSHLLFQSQNSYPNSVKQEPMHCPPSTNQEPLHYSHSVKQESLNYPPSVKPESLNYPLSVKQESLNYPPSVKQESLNYPPSVKQEPLNYPPSVKQESLQYTHQTYPQSSTACSDSANNIFTHNQLSNSSCSSSISGFIDHILTTYEPVPEVDECPWLEGFNLILMSESVNLSDVEEL